MQGFFSKFKTHFAYAALFSFFDNMLMLASPIYMMQIFDRVMTSHSQETLLMLTIATLVGLIVMMFLEMLRARLLSVASVLMDQQLGSIVILNLFKASARQGNIADHTQGLRNIAQLRSFLTGPGIFAFFDAPWAVVFTIVIFLIHPLMGLVSLLGALALFLIGFLNERITKPHLHNSMQSVRQSSQFIDMSVRNAELISAMGMFEGVHSRWFILNNVVLSEQLNLNKYSCRINAITKFIRQLIQVVMLATGAYLILTQNLSSGIMIAATIILSRALAPVEQSITTWKGFVEARTAYHELNALLSKIPAEHQVMTLPPPTGELTVDRLLAGPPGGKQAIIKNISFRLSAGEMLAIIGPSAAGKSSLIRLLVGVWKPQSGNVRLDGVDVSEWPREQLGKYIGYLPQEADLMAGTIAENIARMNSVAVYSQEIVDAAKMAGVHDLILKLPQGYETKIGGNDGFVLSGGQRQRIAFARALFRIPKFIVLDEPNSNLDGEGEIALLNVLAEIKKMGSTIVIVSHKPNLLVHADKVLVLRDGNIEAFGPKQEVLGKSVRTASSTHSNVQHAIPSSQEGVQS